MSFRSDLDSDFQEILAGDFAARILFSPGQAEWDTTGIFDDSWEVIETNEQGQNQTAEYIRFTIWYRDAPIDIIEKMPVDVYRDPEDTVSYDSFKVHDIQFDVSEGNALIVLRKI